jgi:hypothetical protein
MLSRARKVKAMRLNFKSGLGSLVLGSLAYAAFVWWVVTVCLDWASAPSNVLNVLGALGLALLVLTTITLTPPFFRALKRVREDMTE